MLSGPATSQAIFIMIREALPLDGIEHIIASSSPSLCVYSSSKCSNSTMIQECMLYHPLAAEI